MHRKLHCYAFIPHVIYKTRHLLINELISTRKQWGAKQIRVLLSSLLKLNSNDTTHSDRRLK